MNTKEIFKVARNLIEFILLQVLIWWFSYSVLGPLFVDFLNYRDAISQWSNKAPDTSNFECLKTYTLNNEMKVAVRFENGETKILLCNKIEKRKIDQQDAEKIFSNLKEGKKYKISYVGSWSYTPYYPVIVSAEEVK